MKITTVGITAAFDVVVNADSSLPPDADQMAQQLRAVMGEAVRAWQDKLRGTVIVGDVAVQVSVPSEMVMAATREPVLVAEPALVDPAPAAAAPDLGP